MDARVQRMIDLWLWYCGEANLGYDQYNRWDFPAYGDIEYAGECDCSSLMYHCAVEAGFDLPTSGTRYTGTMHRHFTAAGFAWRDCANAADAPAGAILYKDGHTAGWTGRYIAEAYGDENGGSHGGRAGDQGNETRLSPPRGGWEGYFYWPEAQPAPVWPQEPEEGMVNVDFIIEEGSNGVAHEMDQGAYAYRWEKWSSGKLVVIISDWYNGGNGQLFRSMYYLPKTVDFPKDVAFVEPPYVTGLTLRATQGWVSPQVYGLAKNKLTFWVFSPARAIPKFYADVRLEGSWK